MVDRLWDAFYQKRFGFDKHELENGLTIDPVSKSNLQLLKERIQSTIYKKDSDNFLLYLYSSRPKNNTVVTFICSFCEFIQESMSSQEVSSMMPLLPQVILDELARYKVLDIHIDDPNILVLHSGRIVLNSNMSLNVIESSKILDDWYRQVYNGDDALLRLKHMNNDSSLRRYLFSRLETSNLYAWRFKDEYCRTIIEYFGVYLRINSTSHQTELRINVKSLDPDESTNMSKSPSLDEMPILYDEKIQDIDDNDIQFTEKFNLTYWFLHVDPDQFSDVFHAFEDEYCAGNRLAVKLGNCLVKISNETTNFTEKRSDLLHLFVEFHTALENDRISKARSESITRWVMIVSGLLIVAVFAFDYFVIAVLFMADHFRKWI